MDAFSKQVVQALDRAGIIRQADYEERPAGTGDKPALILSHRTDPGEHPWMLAIGSGVLVFPPPGVEQPQSVAEFLRNVQA